MRLSHVTLHVSAIPQSRAFYQRLGFTLIVAADHYCRFLVGGETTLSIEAHPGPITPAAHVCIEFSAPAALDTEIERLAGAGVAVAEQPNDKPWLWREARLIDPDGHILIYFFAGENKLTPPWRVKP